MENCCICGETLSDGRPTAVLTQKGSDSINRVSGTCDDNKIQSRAGQSVHLKCRRDLCRPPKKSTSKVIEEESAIGRRSVNPRFSAKEHCFFCGQPAKNNGRKRGYDVIPVRTKDFQDSIAEICRQREDEWSEIVLGRLEYAQDLHAADAVYHQACSVNFRTGKKIPRQHCSDDSTEGSKRPRKGRPVDSAKAMAFLKVAQFLEQNDEEQITISDLVNKMEDYLEGSGEQAYSAVYMKAKLQEHFGDKIVVTNLQKKANVVTFQRTVKSIINEFYLQPKRECDEAEKAKRIVETAAKLLKSDIKNLDVSSDSYPSSDQMSSVEHNLEFIPEFLRLFLRILFVGKDVELQIASVGQAIVQAARPRVVLAPLQLGLGVQMHHHFASKFLIDSLHAHGFCSSYSTVQKYERSAAATQGTDIPSHIPGCFVQYAADNVDHNTRTLDGTGTFHGMGIIAMITPATKTTKPVPIKAVSAEEIASAGRIDICHYQGPAENIPQLIYKELRDVRVQDSSENLDLLWKLSQPLLRSPRPAWSGTMQMICNGNYPGQSSVMFLPMIDLDPGDMTCIYSTLVFISEQARRYHFTPVVTFDQPLWWKALMIVQNEPQESALKSIVLRLGGLHIEMSFLGCIGHLMASSGLQEVLEVVYAKNAVGHMLSGKAVARAIRGHFLVDAALNALLVCSAFNIPLPVNTSVDDEIQQSASIEEQQENPSEPQLASIDEEIQTADEPGSTEERQENATEPQLTSVDGEIQTANEPESTDKQQENANVPQVTEKDLESAGELFKSLVDDASKVEQVCSSDVLSKIAEKLESNRKCMQNQRTAVLWMQYMVMVDILRKFIRAERTGNWKLHLQAVRDMLPYFAAAGHNLYAKSAFVYLQLMHELQEKHPDVHNSFQDGLHVVRRSDRYWAGLSTDLVIEQVLMRSVKTCGGLTRGRGMSETQRLVWLLSMPACADVNNAMQNLTGVKYVTSEQHKDTTRARQERDYKDTNEIITYLSQRNPFSSDPSLHSISSGVVAGEDVNAEKAKEVGEKILTSMIGKSVRDYTFRKKEQVVTLASKTAVKLRDGSIQVDPQLLFQRLTLIATGGQYDNPQSFFKFEMCSFPPALFDSSLLPRQANKPALADTIWAISKTNQTAGPTGNVHFVLDGGALLHRVLWPRNITYDAICSLYVQYVERRYGKATVVFDGYENGPSTKDGTHQRRTGTHGPTVNVDGAMLAKLKKEDFLSNKENKQKFINLLSGKLELSGSTTLHAEGDADLLIVQTAIQSAQSVATVLIGDDTDLLVLLCYHADVTANELFFKPEPKQRSNTRRIWNIKKTKSVLGPDVCANILFVHAVLGCDTTSRVHGIGKGAALAKVRTDMQFRDQATVFNRPDATKDEVIAAGEKSLLCLYKSRSDECLDSLRYSKFCQKVATGATFVQPESLPPTSAAAAYHSQRVYFQVQQWKGALLEPEDWGWRLTDGKLLPIPTDLPPAHESLLEVVRCNCSAGCSTQRCTCRKHGLDCSTACGVCKGQSCTNSAAPDFGTDTVNED